MNLRVAALLMTAVALCASAATPKARPPFKAKPAPKAVAVPPAPPLYPARSTEPIVFIWPTEGMVVSSAGEFVFGSVVAASAPFAINGTTISVHKDGGFLAWLPIAPGTFTFRGELALSSGTAVAERTIIVPTHSAPMPLPADTLEIDAGSLLPKTDLDLRPGDWLLVRMKATPGKTARYRIGKGPWRDLREANPALGLYEELRQITPLEEFEAAPVEYKIVQGWSSAVKASNGRVSASSRIIATASVKASTAGFVNIKTGPANGFLSFPLPGTRLPVTGRDNGSLRVQLSDTLSGWIEAKDVRLSSAAPVRAVTGSISVVKSTSGATVLIGLTDKAAFTIEPSKAMDALNVRLYHAIGHTNWIVNEAQDFVKEVRWRQNAWDTVDVTILLRPGATLWGWWPSFEGGSLKIDLRQAPTVSLKNPLSQIRVMLDPGHMPSATGAFGPLGTTEMDANYAIALAAKARLEREGAVVLMTRNDPGHEVSLVERPRLALEQEADLFVSLHNNSLPDGENPFAKPRGFSVFYYHPHSFELGRAVHAAFKESIRLPDEGLRWGNLLVARQSAMPSILVENAYMIFPEQEALLNDSAFREELATAITRGVKSFLAGYAKRR
ncbi:MAG: N-acetylmuramoyl-L-alanine amidase [Elusimicrobiota bacterium]